MIPSLDTLDHAIIAALLEDGRLSQVQLAERIPLSATAIARRIRALEDAGVIGGYQARINRKAIGFEMTGHVFISLQDEAEQRLEAFEAAVVAAPSIIGCELMSGEDDYILTVLARGLSDYERIHKEELSQLPGVTRLRSSFVLREVKQRAMPVSIFDAPRPGTRKR